MTGKSSDLLHRRVFPDTDLILNLTSGKSVSRDEFVRILRPHEIADLSCSSASADSDEREERTDLRSSIDLAEQRAR